MAESAPQGLKTPNVFLDTQLFHETGFDLTNPKLVRVCELSRAGHVKPCMSTITVREVQSGFCLKVDEAGIAKIPAVLKYSRLPDVVAKVKPLDRDALKAELLSQFDLFLEQCKVEVLTVDPSMLATVLDHYFARRPPFGDKKKSEFPDALTVEALLRKCSADGVQISVVSGDGDLGSVCSEKGPLFYFSSLASFLDAVASENAVLSEFVRSTVLDRKSQITDQAERAFYMLGFRLDGERGEVERAKLSDIAFRGPVEVVSLEADRATVEVEAELFFVADIEYVDSSTESYDRETGSRSWSIVTETVEGAVKRTITVDLSFQGMDPSTLEIEAVSIDARRDVRVETSRMSGYPWK